MYTMYPDTILHDRVVGGSPQQAFATCDLGLKFHFAQEFLPLVLNIN